MMTSSTDTVRHHSEWTYPERGPSCDKSNTCRGLSSHWNLERSLAPWLPPLLGLMNTTSGLMCGDGMGFTMNGRWSSRLFRFFNEAFFFFRIDDLNDPCKNRNTFKLNVIFMLGCLLKGFMKLSCHQSSALLAPCTGKPLLTHGFPIQRASNEEIIYMSWCYHAIYSVKCFYMTITMTS